MAAPALWPQWLINSFLSAHQPRFANDESAFYGPYTRFLYCLFGLEGSFEITPQYHIPDTPRGAIDAVALFTVELNKHPMLFIQVKSPSSFQFDSKRKLADDQMRERFRDLRPSVDTPRLPAISAFGTRLAFYEYTTATNAVTPPAIAADPIYLNDLAPAERWDCDLLQPEGTARMLQVVDDVKAMCQALNH